MGRRYVLVCRGPTCKSQGSVEVRLALKKALAERGETDVVVLPYTCFDLCGRGPNAVIYPDGEWFEALEPRDVPDLVDHVVGKRAAAHLRAVVDEHHAAECYRIFDEVIPELEAEAAREESPRRGWLGALKFPWRRD